MPQTRSKPTKTADALTASILAFHAKHGAVDEVPRGWVTVIQYADACGISVDAAKSALGRMARAGLVSSKIYRTHAGDGRIRQARHFDLNPKK